MVLINTIHYRLH